MYTVVGPDTPTGKEIKNSDYIQFLSYSTYSCGSWSVFQGTYVNWFWLMYEITRLVWYGSSSAPPEESVHLRIEERAFLLQTQRPTLLLFIRKRLLPLKVFCIAPLQKWLLKLKPRQTDSMTLIIVWCCDKMLHEIGQLIGTLRLSVQFHSLRNSGSRV